MQTLEHPSLVYTYNGAVYLNITSRCPTACSFCIKSKWDWKYRGYNLKLANEPSVEEVLSGVSSVVDTTPAVIATTPAVIASTFGKLNVNSAKQSQEAVFCGYGESTYRLAEMKEISRALRAMGFTKIRLNTVGLGNLINGRDIAPELAEILDSVSISLNTADPRQYVELHRPLPQFRDKAFESVLDFIRSSVKYILETVVTAVDFSQGASSDVVATPQVGMRGKQSHNIGMPLIDVSAVSKLAQSLGAKFRLRPSLD